MRLEMKLQKDNCRSNLSKHDVLIICNRHARKAKTPKQKPFWIRFLEVSLVLLKVLNVKFPGKHGNYKHSIPWTQWKL
jgi:hypothetical protein